MKKIHGIIIPAVTPFDETDAVRLDWLGDNIARWNQTAVAGYMCLGSNGEFKAVDDSESLAIIRTFAEVKRDDKSLICGIGRESLAMTLRFMDRVVTEVSGIDYLSVLVPHYFAGRMTDEAVIGYYTAIADRAPLPVLLYCAPAFANGVKISAKALAELAGHPNIAGIKDTSKDMMAAYMDAAGNREDFQIIAGSVSNLGLCMQRGGEAGVVSAANYFPAECAKIIRVLDSEGVEAAVAYCDEVKKLSAATGGRDSVAGVKAAMNLLGYEAGVPRKPVLPVSEEGLALYRTALSEAGMLD